MAMSSAALGDWCCNGCVDGSCEVEVRCGDYYGDGFGDICGHGYPILDKKISFVWTSPPSCLGDPLWILKRAGLESSG